MSLQLNNQFIQFLQDKNIDIPENFIQIFCQSISMDEWIDSETAYKFLDFDRYDSFIKTVKRNLIEIEDYREISKEEFLQNRPDLKSDHKQNGGQNKKYYQLSPEGFKSLLLMRKNNRGLQYRQYMITLEKVFKQFLIFIHEQSKTKELNSHNKLVIAQNQLIFNQVQYSEQIIQLNNQLTLMMIENEQLENQLNNYTVFSIHKIDEEEQFDLRRPQLVSFSQNPNQLFKQYCKLLDKYYEEEHQYTYHVLRTDLSKRDAKEFKQQYVNELNGDNRVQHRVTQRIIPLFD